MNSPKAARRQHIRIQKAVPAMITVGKHTLAATTKDLSLGGVFFFTDVQLRRGTELQIVLTLPKEVGLPESRMVRCYGRILRIETSSGNPGAAAQIEEIANLQAA